MLFIKKNNGDLNKSNIFFIGIDDFALKKCHKYGTVMIDHDSRDIISCIDSREISDVQIG